eukprot:TRINITY_DN3059_c0_g1_i9.p1 TRINITY_DN3059_c0_g1~~TRINITY_DN3059_c0_g1_i9.p1  ORF type:complete len:125 (+),score=21.36 TRINITY_DN3059_c0_g1_i9:398-772(+)
MSSIILVFTEFTSNVSTVTVFGPILGLLAVAIGQDPRLLMIPATICSNCAFMLPVATPPNTIVYGTGRLSVKEMAVPGLIMNIICMFLIPGYMLLVAPGFGITVGHVPQWAWTNTTNGTVPGPS